MFLVYLILVGLIFGSLCAYVAGEKGRRRGSWFIAGFFLSLLALIALAAIPALTEEERQRREEQKHGKADEELEEWKRKMKKPL